MKTSPLDSWIAKKTSLEGPGEGLSLSDLKAYRLHKLRDTVSYASSQSPFYRKKLSGFPVDDLRDISDFSRIPFTTVDDLEFCGAQFLCASQSLVERVVTLNVPGPLKKNLRVYFSSNDLERTVDFFHHGMTTFTEPGQKVMIMMPGKTPDSVGELLARSLRRIPAEGFIYGLVQDPSDAIREIMLHKTDVVVGIPTNILSLARHKQGSSIGRSTIKSVLLASDYVSPGIVTELQLTWGCNVFCHYGSTEMGFEGGVECENRNGYHLTESDLYFEIVDPESGEIGDAGEIGEVVFTTLTREAMPLIRYRTADLSRFIAEDCPCGSSLMRLDKIRGRIWDTLRLASNHWLGIQDLDDSIFCVPEVIDYQASLTSVNNASGLNLTVELRDGSDDTALEKVKLKLKENIIVNSAMKDGALLIGAVAVGKIAKPSSTAVKRTISDQRASSA